MLLKEKFEEYSETEFLTLVMDIFYGHGNPPISLSSVTG
jgi:hypothetical protein